MLWEPSAPITGKRLKVSQTNFIVFGWGRLTSLYHLRMLVGSITDPVATENLSALSRLSLSLVLS
jgi:hypothetical protein